MSDFKNGLRVFVTGGSGFIGGEVLILLLRRGYDVINFDIEAPHFSEQLDCWVEGDVRDVSKLTREIEAFDPHYVLHLASDIDVTITRLEEFATIIDGTANVMAALHSAPSLRRFVHVSTQFTVRPGVEPRDERHLEPYTVYGEAKAKAEEQLWRTTPKVPWFILRPVIVWGPNHPTFGDQIFKHIASGYYLHPSTQIPIMRAFGFVRNVAEQMVRFLELPANATNRHVFYVGDETIDYSQWADGFSIALRGRAARRIPKWLLDLMGQVGDLLKMLGLPSPIDSGRAFRMSTSSAVNLAVTHELIGPSTISLEDGIAETVDWLRLKYPTRYRKSLY